MGYQEEYQRWKAAVRDPELLREMEQMDAAAAEDAFYRTLTFGTGGLRGILGAGTNRMNEYVVARASQGLANHLLQSSAAPSVVIGYDARLCSDAFARTAAAVFAANGVTVHLWPELTPVPTVSFAVRHLRASAGVMITASHNPAEYNGYKVYGADGCQITTEAAAAIMAQIDRLDFFSDVRRMEFGAAEAEKRICPVDPGVLDRYIDAVKAQSVLFGDRIDRNASIVYTPLNGAGLKPVLRVLTEAGFSGVTVVEEQRCPDGRFPTCPFPNPELPEAMALGLRRCEETGAELLLATDPDCDRCGVAVRDGQGYRLLTGNEVGLLLLDYVCAQRTRHGRMPAHPVFLKTIVTSELAEKIAVRYGVETVNVLTGFKFIGEVIGQLEREGRASDFICGFEESCGYLTGAYVRDKDAVNAAFMICEMFAYYRTRGISLPEKLAELYAACGYCLHTLHSFEFRGPAGMEKMRAAMAAFRRGLPTLGGEDVVRTEDYSLGLRSLPKADVLTFSTAGSSAVVRPSGTEPKLKLYISVTAEDRTEASRREQAILTDLAKRLE